MFSSTILAVVMFAIFAIPCTLIWSIGLLLCSPLFPRLTSLCRLGNDRVIGIAIGLGAISSVGLLTCVYLFKS